MNDFSFKACWITLKPFPTPLHFTFKLPTISPAPELRVVPSVLFCDWCLWRQWPIFCSVIGRLTVTLPVTPCSLFSLVTCRSSPSLWTPRWTPPQTQARLLSPWMSCFPVDRVQHFRDALGVFWGTGYMCFSWQPQPPIDLPSGADMDAVSSDAACCLFEYTSTLCPTGPWDPLLSASGRTAEVHLGQAQQRGEERSIWHLGEQDAQVQQIKPNVVTSRDKNSALRLANLKK